MPYGLPFFIEPEEWGVKGVLDEGYSSLFGKERLKSINIGSDGSVTVAIDKIYSCIHQFIKPLKESYVGNPLHGNCEICTRDPVNNPRCCGYKRFIVYSFSTEKELVHNIPELQDNQNSNHSKLEEIVVAAL